jgi:tetratricopeptide (TPR) repeat protein
MAKHQTDHLLQLIQSMTKAEKRHFKLHSKKGSSVDDLKFIQLFDVLDKMKEYKEESLIKKVPGIKRAQISNIKAHLYKQLLGTLRLLHASENIDMQIRERIDYGRVLYNKGLYQQSLKVLDKAKQMAVDSKHDILRLEIVDFERLIESQYITRSIDTRAERLTGEAEELNRVIGTSDQLSNLALRLYSLYLKVGYSRNVKDYYMIREFFQANLPKVTPDKLSFYERLYLYQSHVWYNYIIQDFLNCYRYAQKWVDLFREEPEMILEQPDLYMKGMHNLLATLFNIRHYTRFCEVLRDVEEFADHSQELKFTENTKLQVFLYVYSNKINKHFLEGSFSEGVKLVPEIESGIAEFAYRMDHHRILVLYYKIGCLYFGSGDNKNAIKYLNMIINFKDVNFREDIHCFARILNLIAHYELGNDDLVEYQIRSVYRFLAKMEDLHKVQLAIFKFLRKLSTVYESDLKSEFVKLHETLVKLADEPFEKRPFLYLDIISWLESKIQGISVQEVIRVKFA